VVQRKLRLIGLRACPTCQARAPESASGTFRTSHLHRRMSAIWGKADMTRTLDNDAKYAIATSATLNLAVQWSVYRTSVKKGRDPPTAVHKT
jgi:hypothetical protein